MKRLFLIFLLLLIAIPCFGQTLKRHLEPETVNYCSLSGASCTDQFTFNEQIKLIKYNSGSVTLSGLTCNISNATSYLFVSNPSSDLRKWLGYYITFTSSTGNTLKVKVSAVGTGETLQTNIFASFNFTSGWSTSNATIIDATNFNVTSASNYIRTNNTHTIGALYKSSFSAIGIPNNYLRDNNGVILCARDGSNNYATALGNSTLINGNTGTGNLQVTTLVSQKVLTPSATGIYFTDPVVTGTFNYNATSFTATITKD